MCSVGRVIVKAFNASPLFTVVVITFALTFVAAYMTVAIYGYHLAQQQTPKVAQGVQSLPEKCRPLFGDGTTAWQDCMGVGS